MEAQKSLLSFLVKCADAFDVESDYSLADHVLKPLFKERNFNSDEAEVLGKVVALNGLYRAGILDFYRMAKHIYKHGRHLDKLLGAGNPEAVEVIRGGHGIKAGNGREIDFYSFATKYCHWHRPDCYPMFDSYVEVALKAYLRFAGEDAKVKGVGQRDFTVFCQTVDAAKVAVKWPETGYKRFDQALWIMGQDFEDELSASTRKEIGPAPRGLRPT